MASSIVSGSSGGTNPRGYSVDPMERRRGGPPSGYDYEPELKSEKPENMRSPIVYDEETKITFSCQNGTLFLKISSALLTFSFILQVIAVGAPYWAAGWRRDKMSWHEGVWMTCYRTETENNWICGSYDYLNKSPGVPGWYMFTQAVGLASLVVFLPAMCLNFFYTMHPKEKMFQGLFWFNVILTSATALCPIMMVIAFGAGHPKRDRFPIPWYDEDYDDSPFEFHFSFVFEIIAFLVSTAAAVLEILDMWRNEYH